MHNLLNQVAGLAPALVYICWYGAIGSAIDL